MDDQNSEFTIVQSSEHSTKEMASCHLLTAGEAARAIGVSVPAISRALKTGRLAYVEKTRRGYLIDPNVLFHVFRHRPEARKNDEAADREELADLMPEVKALRIANAKLEVTVECLKQLVDAEWRRADAAEADRDKWRSLCDFLLKRPDDES